MRGRLRRIALVVRRSELGLGCVRVVAIAFGVFTLALMAGCSARKGYVWILPEGYGGWVLVEFGVPGAPTLSEEDGFQVIRVPSDGVVRTSGAMIPSPTRDMAFAEARGKRVTVEMPSAGFTVNRTAVPGRVRLYSFFGTQADWDRTRRDADGDPVPGSVEPYQPASPDRE